jgi:hypothetical protein
MPVTEKIIAAQKQDFLDMLGETRNNIPKDRAYSGVQTTIYCDGGVRQPD